MRSFLSLVLSLRQWRRKYTSTGAIASLLVLGLSVSGCTRQLPGNPAISSPQAAAELPANPRQKKVILTTFTVLADMVQNVAGDRAIVQSLTKLGAEIHGYEPTPSDLVRAQSADLILDNGLGLERWADRFYANLKQTPRITLSEGIQPIPIREGAYLNRPNPHAWMSPANALVYVENIRKALVQLDPVNADTYTANAATYSQKIRTLDQTLRQELAKLPADQRYMVTCEGAFTYLINDYGLKEGYIWPVNAEQQGTPQQVGKTIDLVKANQVPTIFCESTVSDKAQRQVAAEAGAKFGGVFYVDSLTDAQGVAPTYLKLLEYNVNTLIRGLRGN